MQAGQADWMQTFRDKSTSNPETNSNANPVANSKANAKANPKANPEANQEANHQEANSEANPEANPEANSEANPVVNPKADPVANSGALLWCCQPFEESVQENYKGWKNPLYLHFCSWINLIETPNKPGVFIVIIGSYQFEP